MMSGHQQRKAWPAMAAPKTRYAQADDVNIAYQVVGEGPVDLVWAGGLWSNIEVLWEEPAWAAFMRRLAEFSRLLIFDRRGCGVSDRGGALVTPTLEERMNDILAVLDAAGSDRASLFGFSEGGNLAALFAATYPQRTNSVILYGTVARFLKDDDHPWGWGTDEEIEGFIAGLRDGWGVDTERAVRAWAPSMAGDRRFADWYAKWRRQSLSRRDVVPFIRALTDYDAVEIFPAVRVPTLVLHRQGDTLMPVQHSRWIVEQIPDAHLAELPGVDHLPFVGDAESVVGEIADFLIGSRATAPRHRRLLTLLVTDIVGSTPTAASLGDQAWLELLAALDRQIDDHLARFGGSRVKQLNDGCLAAFEGPARAIRCAVGIIEAAARLGLQMSAGVHCGECETVDDDVQGIAVHVAARIAELAGPSEVLVTGTVRDLVAGSGIRFATRRDVELQGVTGRRTVYPVLTRGATPDDVRRLTSEGANVFRLDGEYWTLSYDGRVATVRDTKGMHDLARLLASPQREFHVLDLILDTSTDPEAPTSADIGPESGVHLVRAVGEPVVDEAARNAYQQRIAELDDDLTEAQRRGEPTAAARAREEREALVDQLKQAYGLGGRPRRMSDDAERARKAVYRRLRTASSRIADCHPPLGRHLDAALRTGVYCSYQPDRDLRWTVEQ